MENHLVKSVFMRTIQISHRMFGDSPGLQDPSVSTQIVSLCFIEVDVATVYRFRHPSYPHSHLYDFQLASRTTRSEVLVMH